MDAERPTWKQRLTDRRTWLAVGAGLAVGAIGAGVGWQVWLKPQRDLAQLRFDTMNDVLKMYGLQTAYKQSHGTYANDLETLLAGSPDREAFKARLASHVDINTVAVVNEGAKFKIEVNVLDKDRTLVKIKGPPPEFIPRDAPKTIVEPGQAVDGDAGKPVLPPAR